MSKSVRLKDYLYEEIERLAKAERRSMVSMVELLLEQALQLPEHFDRPKVMDGDGQEKVSVEVQPGQVGEVRTDFKKGQK